MATKKQTFQEKIAKICKQQKKINMQFKKKKQTITNKMKITKPKNIKKLFGNKKLKTKEIIQSIACNNCNISQPTHFKN